MILIILLYVLFTLIPSIYLFMVIPLDIWLTAFVLGFVVYYFKRFTGLEAAYAEIKDKLKK